jgi:ATP-dependent Clp protease ATP-binding subunit ClpA
MKSRSGPGLLTVTLDTGRRIPSSQEVLHQHQAEKVKVSVVLLDEVERASDALWNLLLEILDRATLMLGDNRKVDFSQSMIFMTSNLGADEFSNDAPARVPANTRPTVGAIM